MKKLFTLIAAALLAVGANAQQILKLGGKGDNGADSWGWSLTFGKEAYFCFSNQWGELTLASSGTTEGAEYKLVVAEANENVNLRFYTDNPDTDPNVSVNQTEITGTIPAGVSKIGLQGKIADTDIHVLSFEINGAQTAYSTSWGTSMYSGDYTMTGQWSELFLTPVASTEPQLITVNAAESIPADLVQLKVYYADGTQGYPSVEGTKTEVRILKPVAAISLQAKAAGTCKISSVTTAPIVRADLGLKETDVSTGWNGDTYDESTKTITCNGGGKGWWLDKADYSAFDNLVIEFNPAVTAEGKVVVEYNGAENSVVSFNPGATCVVVPLDATGKSSIKQIYIQGVNGSTYTLNAAYIAMSSATPTANLGTPPTWTIAGSSLILGTDWDVNDNNNNMTTTDNITYTLVKENVTLEEGVDYKYKVVKNHSWSNENYGNGDKDAILKVTETAIYKVTFTFNAQTKVLTATAEKTGEAGPIVHTYSVMGNIVDDWKTDIDMTEGEGGIYTVTINNVAAGSYEFKVRLDHAWAIAYPSDNYQLTVEKDNSTVVITYNSSTNEVNATVTPPTGIEALTIDTDANALMYNLAGQRVDKDYKGVVIKNGKKVVVK